MRWATPLIVLFLLTVSFAALPPAEASIVTLYEVAESSGAPRPLGPGAIPLALADDFVTDAFAIGFTTTFWGTPTDLFWVGSNGFVTLFERTGPGCCEGQELPTPGDPDGMVAAFWTDLNPNESGTVRFERLSNLEGHPALVVDYSEVPGPGGPASFQFVLFRDGVFEIRVENASVPAGAVASIGAENAHGTRGITVLRGDNLSLENRVFRFTPVTEEVADPPPVIESVSPTKADREGFFTVIGDGFVEGSRVRVGDLDAFTVFGNSTRLGALVPREAPTGPNDVTVHQPDGKSTTLTGALNVSARFGVDEVFPRRVTQGDSVFVFGGGFTDDTTLLLGGTPLWVRNVSGTFIHAVVPPTLPPGLHRLQAIDPKGGSAEFFDPVLVLGLPDVVVESVRATRASEIRTDVTPSGIGLPAGWRIDVVVRNAGDATASRVALNVTASPTDGPLSFWSARDYPVLDDDLGPLSPGERREISGFWGDPTRLGEYRFDALATIVSGQVDRDPSNDAASTSAYVVASGIGGTDVQSVEPPTAPELCDVPVLFCKPVMETRHWTSHRQEATDVHEDTVLRIDANMSFAEFDFEDFPIVFTTSSTDDDGVFRSCTTWRFLGEGGHISVRMRDGNGFTGRALLPTAGSRTSDGTFTRATWTDTRVAGIVVDESERTTEEGDAPEARTTYLFPDSESRWRLVAEGLKGDFTRCSASSPAGNPWEEFAYAALPDDVSREVPSFDGLGFARHVTVDYLTDSTTHTSEVFP